MKKKQNKKGFTLAELLIVVAIIGILVAIAIPVFSGQLQKAKKATDDANIRAAYAQYIVEAMDKNWDVSTKQLKKGEVQAYFKQIGVEKMQYYTTVTLPAKGVSWEGKAAGAGAGCAIGKLAVDGDCSK